MEVPGFSERSKDHGQDHRSDGGPVWSGRPGSRGRHGDRCASPDGVGRSRQVGQHGSGQHAGGTASGDLSGAGGPLQTFGFPAQIHPEIEAGGERRESAASGSAEQAKQEAFQIPGSAPGSSSSSGSKATASEPGSTQGLGADEPSEVSPFSYVGHDGRPFRTLAYSPRHSREPLVPSLSRHFPLPLITFRDDSGRPASARRRSKRRSRWYLTADINALIMALNSLYYGLADDSALVPRPPPAPPQVSLLKRLILHTHGFRSHLGNWEHSERPPAEVSDVDPPIFFYGQPVLLESGSFVHDPDPRDLEKGAFVLLTSNRAALPMAGCGAAVSAVDFLPDELRRLYEKPSAILRHPPPSAPELNKIRPINGVMPGHYPRLINRMVEAGIVELLHSPPLVINDLFGIVKDSYQDRVIFAGQRCNLYFNPPPNPELPTPSDFLNLLLPPDGKVFVGKTDVSNMFFLLAAPEWLRPYFGLQPICSHPSSSPHSDDCRWPRFTVLPMGWSHSVTIAQAVMLASIRSSLMGRAVSISGSSLVVLGSARFTYVDDAGVLSDSLPLASDMFKSAIESMRRVGLTPNLAKSHDPREEEPVFLLGFQISINGMVRPRPDLLKRLLLATLFVVRAKKTTPAVFRSLLGSWIWVLLLNRPLLSVLSAASFAFASSLGREASEVPEDVLQDLRLLYDLAPLLCFSLKAPRCASLLCSDACLTGGAAVSLNVGPEHWDLIFSLRVKKGWYSRLSAFEGEEAPNLIFDDALLPFFLDRRWQCNIYRSWEKPDIIDALEGHALLLGLRWLLSNPLNHGTRVLVFTDSTALLGAVVKGRSSSLRLNNVCRRIAAMVGASGCCLSFLWVPSDLNPADGPSRFPSSYFP